MCFAKPGAVSEFDAPMQSPAYGMAFQIRGEADGKTRRFVYISPSCEALNGITAEAALADPMALYSLILPEHQERVFAAEQRAVETLTPFDIEVPFRQPDGGVRWCRITSLPRLEPDGTTLWDGVQVDVTERREAEAKAAEDRRRLDQVVETTGLGLWEYDIRADRLTWSDRTKALFGLPAGAEVTFESYRAAIHPDDQGRTLAAYQAARDTPGGSDFSFEHRTVGPDGEVRWVLAHGRVIWDGDQPALVLGSSLDITERKRAEEQHVLLVREMAHRAQNGLAVMMSLVTQSARGAASVVDYEEKLVARMQAMAASQALITEAGGRSLPLDALIDRTLKPFDLDRFDLTPANARIELSPDLAMALALLLHELATNAVKYGALSAANGRVALAWHSEGDGGEVTWREIGGPAPKPPSRKGFGSRLLESALRPRGGAVEVDYHPDGLQSRMSFPLN
ncbi:MAG: PAS domain-containing protein [Caulobacteraceae bacterium]|nr:PAS domain-containing protein [Caulobacteraceae bacterium]